MKHLLWDALQKMVAMSHQLEREQLFESQNQLGIRAEAPDFQDSEQELATDSDDEDGDRMESDYGEFTWSFSLPPKSAAK